MMNFRNLATTSSFLTVLTFGAANAQEMSFDFNLTEGAGIQVCEALLVAARRAPPEVIGQCDLPPLGRPDDEPARFIDWSVLREAMHPGFKVPEWEEMDLSQRENLDKAYFIDAFGGYLIKYTHAKDGYARWNEVLTDEEIRFLIRRYLDEGGLPEDFLHGGNGMTISPLTRYYAAEFAYGGAQNEVIRSDFYGIDSEPTCFSENADPFRQILLFDGRNVAQSLSNRGFRSDQAYVHTQDDIVIYRNELFGIRHNHRGTSLSPSQLFIAPYSEGAGFTRFDPLICALDATVIED